MFGQRGGRPWRRGDGGGYRGRGGGHGGGRGGGHGDGDLNNGAGVQNVAGDANEHNLRGGMNQNRGGMGRGRGRWQNGRGGRGAFGNNNANGNNQVHPLGYPKLKLLSENPNDNELVTGLTIDGSFYALINSTERKPQWDGRRLILRVLARASQFNVTNFRQILHGLLRNVIESQYFKTWLAEDVLEVRQRIAHMARASKDEKETFIEDAAILVNEILDKLPDLAMQVNQVAWIVLDALKDPNAFPVETMNGDDDDDDQPSYRRAQKRLQISFDNFIAKKQKQPEQEEENQRGAHRDRAPLDDFRELPILPRDTDILVFEKPRLRRNKKEGAYENLEHYLDIQFRLLREDFIWPIRDAIKTITDQQAPDAFLRQATAGRQQKHVRVYENVYIREPEFDKRSATMVYQVQFDVAQFRKVNWETAKRLLQGSLICLTSDGFKEVFFATIYDRDTRKLSQGVLKVTIDQFPRDGLDRRRAYSFVESPTFFEAYQHVLKALQAIRGPHDMPFERQLVFCEPEVQPPSYIELNPSIDFSCLVDGAREGTVVVRDVRRRADWPTKERIGLDESQFEAVRQSLTKRLAIIQGPPGTGKTFVGLKIVQVILKNSRHDGPILVVCYTNHALDQFLEGIAKFMPDEDQDKIVRIGGSARMKEEVKKFQLMNFLENRRNAPNIDHRLRELKWQRKEVEANIETMKELANKRKEWLLTPEQIGHASENRSQQHLFGAVGANRIGKTYTDILRCWLRDPTPLDAPPPSQRETAVTYRLANYYRMEPYICFKAVRNAGNQAQAAAAWLEVVYELTLFGYSPDEASLAMELNRGNGDAAYNWLAASLGQRGAEQQPAAAAAAVGQEAPAEQEEHVGIEFEALDLERDYQPDDMDREEIAFDGGGEIRNVGGGAFTQPGSKPVMADFLLRCISNARPMTKREAERAIITAWRLPLPERWRLYRYWQQTWFDLAGTKQRDWEERYQRLTLEIREYQDLNLVQHLRAAKVIALTTTGAAKKQAVLQQLKPRIVVIEEAAEILEAHIVTSLSAGCQHLILIGDHQQLRPNPAVYTLAKDYHLDISLFERLIKNGFEYAMLKEQHRMRPEIADPLMPYFYPTLQNHESVRGRDEIRGLAKSIYFVDHRHLEKDEGDSTSHKNVHEARFIVALCKYLIQQGYEAARITILSCYLAQMFEIKKSVTETFLEKDRVRVAVVDNYQGEENDIILLSMVRSNKEGRVGFLNIDNRVCVALSRAKNGFYVVGNFQHLAKNSDLWKNLINRLTTRGDFVGTTLELCCQIHNTSRRVETSDDFKKEAPDGGCREMCNTRLDCGHVCNRCCHPNDAKHEQFQCTKYCEKLCPQGHKCKKLCYEPCGRCHTEIEKRLLCGHDDTVKCYVPVEDAYCTKKCEKILPSCGHVCQKLCGDKCDQYQCDVKVERRLPCGHKVKMPCSQNPSGYRCREKVIKSMPFCDHRNEVLCSIDIADLICRQPCGKPLECDHLCAGTCGECRRGRLHKKCDEDCKRILICGHECKEKCSKACPPCPKACENRCSHSSCGEPKRRGNARSAKGRTCGEPCPQCVEKCAWSCPHENCELRCFEPCKRRRCTEKCSKKLKCRHDCVGECNGGCKHVCTSACGQECKHNCMVECRAECKHVCIGVCGEPCPKMCRVCDKEEFDEMCSQQMIPIDDDEKETATFVQLDDCEVKHLFEVSALDTWFDIETQKMREEQKQEIKLLKCPTCNIPVRTTQRYGAVAKQCLIDVQKVKVKQNGVAGDLANKRDALKAQLQIITSADREASKAINVVADLVVKPATNSLDRNRLANLETLIRFLDEMINFKKTDLVKLENLVSSRASTMQAAPPAPRTPIGGLAGLMDRLRGRAEIDLTANGQSGTPAKLFIEKYYPWKSTSGGSASAPASDQHSASLVKIIENETNSLFDWIAKNAKAPSDQMLDEFAGEWRRTVIFAQLIEFLIVVTNRGTELPRSDWDKVEQVLKTMNGEKAFDSLVEKSAKDVVEILIKQHGCKSGLGISDKERIEIMKALGLTRGHWFKCPNGHIYAIGECGGATQKSICPECKEAIGGGGHRLLDSNAVATEMDGATQSAYEAEVVHDRDFAMRLQQRLNM